MRQEKQLLLDSISDTIKSSGSFVLTSYEKIDANVTADFRQNMLSAGGQFMAVKKRVFVKAAQECGIEVGEVNLDGHIGVAFMGEDYVDATKKLYSFYEDNNKLMQILGGHFDGKLVSPNEVEQISKLPTKDEMRAQFLSLLTAPMADTVGVMQALLTSVMHCLENKVQEES